MRKEKRIEKKKGKKGKEMRNKKWETVRKEKMEEKEKEGKGKGRFLAFERSKFDSSRTKIWSTQWDLRVDTKKLEFRQTPRGRIFSYLVYL